MYTLLNDLSRNRFVLKYLTDFERQDILTRDMDKYEHYCQPFSVYERMYIASLVASANFLLASRKYSFLYKIEWVFAKSREGIENNYPHTHDNIIVLPFDFAKKSFQNLLKTIVHEKVHIYQRYFTIPTNILFFDYWGLTMHSYEKKDGQRSNPDINKTHYMYYDSVNKTHKISFMKYLPSATSITHAKIVDEDVVRRKDSHSNEKDTTYSNEKDTTYFTLLKSNSYQNEHPNEVMACLLTDMIMTRKKHRPTEEWFTKVASPH